ncbi:MAG: CHASE2 domain-containing protein [Desulforhopalus sp.]
MIFRLFRFLKDISLPTIGVAITILIGIFYIYQPNFVSFLDHKIYDIILRRNYISTTSDMVEIIDIDEQSLKEFGQWPWPRYRVALLLQKLNQAGALAVGMDILFAEADSSSPVILQQSLKRDLNVDMGFKDLPAALEDNDRLLADILKQGPFVLGFYFSFGGRQPDDGRHELKPVPVSVVYQNASDKDISLLKSEGVISPLSQLSMAAPATGFINTVKDPDGILRSTPILIENEGSYFANLGLSTLWTGLQKPPLILKVNQGGVESLKFGQVVIPLDRNGRFTLQFRGKQRTFKYHSAADVLNDRVKESDLRGKLLLVGTSAAGLEDLRTTPLDVYFPGVEAQATLMDNVLTGDFIKAPDWVPGVEFIVTIIAGLVVVTMISVGSNMFVLITTLLLAILCWSASEWIFSTYRFFVSPLFPLASLAISFGFLTFTRMYHTEQDKAQIRQAFSRYVAPSLVNEIANHPERLNLEGEEKKVTILLSDIREFTSLSEHLSPTEVTTLLNQYLTPITRIIRQHQGTLDKFIGDAVMAFWNAPLDVAGHKRHALLASLQMLEELENLNIRFKHDFGVQIGVGIGLNSGLVRVGNMGSDELFDYTILGDNVNLTSRLEGLTRYYGVDLIVSETMKDIAVEGYEVQEVDLVRVKGREGPVHLFTFRRAASLVPGELRLWQKAFDLYSSGLFRESSVCLAELRELLPDFALYKLFLDRCKRHASDPPTNWDPIFSHLSK